MRGELHVTVMVTGSKLISITLRFASHQEVFPSLEGRVSSCWLVFDVVVKVFVCLLTLFVVYRLCFEVKCISQAGSRLILFGLRWLKRSHRIRLDFILLTFLCWWETISFLRWWDWFPPFLTLFHFLCHWFSSLCFVIYFLIPELTVWFKENEQTKN